jgi:hypothetical protein
MDKRSAFDFIGLYTAILKDCSVYLPMNRVDWDRDLVSLTRHFAKRGQHLFTVDLPALGKHLDASLDEGRLLLWEAPLSRRRFPSGHVPRLFWALWSRLFDDESGCLKADIDPNIVFFLRTLLCVGKKLKVECPPGRLFETTKEFYDVDAQLPVPSDIWDGVRDLANPDSNPLRDKSLDELEPDFLFTWKDEQDKCVLGSIQQAADRTAGLLGIFNAEEHRFRHGPGAVSDLRTGEYKYDFPNWGPRLEEVFPWIDWGTTPAGLMDQLQSDGAGVDSTEPSSRLIAVPKTQRGPRLIASEPTSHQWVQQCIRDFLYDRVAHTPLGESIDFHSQRPSQEFALRASHSGLFCTMDLSSASDRLSCWVVERMFRRNLPLVRAFSAVRTRFIENRIDKKTPDLYKVRKFSTMGSALTFPVQSLVFLNVILGVGKYLEPYTSWGSLHRQVRVFGDDLIFPSAWKPLVERALTRLSFKVNLTKTFSKGNFRESCGMDAFRGNDVTPFYISLPDQEAGLQAEVSHIAVCNNAFLKGLWQTADWYRSSINAVAEAAVVNVSSGAYGLKTYCSSLPPSYQRKIRWDSNLQQLCVRLRVVIARVKTVKVHSATALLQYFTEEPSPYIEYESGRVVAGLPTVKWARVALRDLGFRIVGS